MGQQHDDRSATTGIVEVDATDPARPITYVSPGFERLTGYAAAEVLGRSCALLQGPQTDPRAIAVLGAAVREGREAQLTLLNYRADGTTFWNAVTVVPELGADGRATRWIGVLRDVTDGVGPTPGGRRPGDPLTALPTVAELREEVRGALGRAAVRDQEVALLVVDLEDFEQVNVDHGHVVGDAVLRGVADRLRGLVRPADVLARHEGAAFALLLPAVATDGAAAASDLAWRLLLALRAPLHVDGATVVVRASVGIAVAPPARSAKKLLRRAALAAAAAKRRASGSVHVHRGELAVPPAPVPATRHADALAAVLNGGMRAVFQPIVQLEDGRVVGYEALARGPEGSPLESPIDLFAAAAALGRTVELDWACRLAAVDAALHAGLGRQASLFLNCEPSAIDAPCPPEHAALWARAERELDLVLELTERAVTDRPAELSRVVARHREAGHGIAVDDLGADVRSLALLPLVEPDVLKLDLRLVQCRPSTDQAAIVAAVAAERERSGAAILAEGIETDEHLAVARALGATLGQGWRYGRPGPLADLRRSAGVRRTEGRLPRHAGRTPFEVVAAARPVREATKELLLPMSHHLEQRARGVGEGAVILSAFQGARHFTPITAQRYAVLAGHASLVAAFGVGLPTEPVPGVRGAWLDPDDALASEWNVIVLGPHFAGALVGRDLGDDGPDRQRRFAYATVYDRGLVIAAARTLVARIAARPPSGVLLAA